MSKKQTTTSANVRECLNGMINGVVNAIRDADFAIREEEERCNSDLLPALRKHHAALKQLDAKIRETRNAANRMKLEESNEPELAFLFISSETPEE